MEAATARYRSEPASRSPKLTTTCEYLLSTAARLRRRPPLAISQCPRQASPERARRERQFHLRAVYDRVRARGCADTACAAACRRAAAVRPQRGAERRFTVLRAPRGQIGRAACR